MDDFFELANEQIREIAEASEGTIQVYKIIAPPIRKIEISVRFTQLNRAKGGLQVKAREKLCITVPDTFPFQYPSVNTLHERFAGFPHVLWKKHLCLYLDSKDWCPGDGMYGFIKRLDSWIRDAASNKLDPDNAPLHPPIEYSYSDRIFVPVVDTPCVKKIPWIGFAELKKKSNYTEIIGWKKHDETCSQHQVVPAILLNKPLSFEYPQTVYSLLEMLKSHSINELISHYILTLTQHCYNDTPLTVVLGTPMRRVDSNGGPFLQHLSVLEISSKDTNKLRELNNIESYTKETQEALIKKVVFAKLKWYKVYEMRPKVTQRRDQSSPMSWFKGKHVTIWGCGAIGTHVAESIVRTGVKSIYLVDDKKVSPGLLVRQGFEDADIGKYKAQALSEKLLRINSNLKVEHLNNDLIYLLHDKAQKTDIIIDCTASSNMQTALEYTLTNKDSHPIIASIGIDNQASSALATLSMPNHSGGTFDLIRKLKLKACHIRKLKLKACHTSNLSQLLESFWPKENPKVSFSPEPGCSEPTFIGSYADVTGLSSRMLNSIAQSLTNSKDNQIGAGWLLEKSGRIHNFIWPMDYTVKDKEQNYSIRISSHVAQKMCELAKDSVRTAGEKVETGGLVFGELNEAAGVLWVTDVEGPPSDSHASEEHFTCGIEGMKELTKKKSQMFRESVGYIGSWHTHPTSGPNPSNLDIETVEKNLSQPETKQKFFLLLILSGNPDDPVLGVHVFKKKLSGIFSTKNAIKIQSNSQLQESKNKTCSPQ